MKRILQSAFLVGAATAVQLLLLVANASCAVSHPGIWSANHQMTGTGINLALLPGAANDSANIDKPAKIIWYADILTDSVGTPKSPAGDTLRSEVWGWLPPSDAISACSAWPTTISRIQGFNPGTRNFCQGFSALSDGRLFLAGGTEDLENGGRQSAVYNPNTANFVSSIPSLQARRWYATATTLPDGKVLISSGSRFKEILSFGGDASDSCNVIPIGDHFQKGADQATWDFSIFPTKSPAGSIAMRRGAPLVEGGSGIFMFGGADNSGVRTNQMWQLYRGANAAALNYDIEFLLRQAYTSGVYTSYLPVARSFHSSTIIKQDDSTLRDQLAGTGAEAMLVVGGLMPRPPATTDSVVDEVMRGAQYIAQYTGDPNGGQIDWQSLYIIGGAGNLPGPRAGHVTFWDSRFQTLYLFGGAGTASGNPTDNQVYALKFADANTVRWHKCDAIGDAPKLRNFAAAQYAYGDYARGASPSLSSASCVVPIYGGVDGSGSVSSELYYLWVVDSTTVRWQHVAVQDAPASGQSVPPALEYCAGAMTSNSHEFYVSGGRDASHNPTAGLWSLQVPVVSPAGFGQRNADWKQRPDGNHAVYGHSLLLLDSDTFVRTPEVFDPVAGSTALLTGSGAVHLQDWYPQTFVIKGGSAALGDWRVFVAGPDVNSYVLTLGSSPTWTAIPTPPSGSSLGSSGFRGGSSVMYRPGKVMKCGSRDTDAGETGEGDAIRTTKVIDLNVGSPSWTASTDMPTARVNFNLVILPDGKVMAFGGMKTFNNQKNVNPALSPELWDPYGASGGVWMTDQTLTPSANYRGYHSTSLLLPDGRILCAGGNYTLAEDPNVQSAYLDHQRQADIYTPYYLLKMSGSTAIPAVRPVPQLVPRRMAYGSRFNIQVTTGTSYSNLRVSLIRPGTVTHGFDQSQRFDSLGCTLVNALGGGQYRYTVVAPIDSTEAPPGEYMMFVLNSDGTPSIAKWVRLGAWSGAAGHPTRVSDFASYDIPCNDGSQAWLKWTPPAADSGDVAPNMTTQYDIRYRRGSSMANEAAFLAYGTHVVDDTVMAPGDPLAASPNYDEITANGLIADSSYYVRMRSKNGASRFGNWSLLSNEVLVIPAVVDCGGGTGGGGCTRYCDGGDGLSARRAPGAAYLQPGGGSTADTLFTESTLFPYARAGQAIHDKILLPFGPKPIEGGYRIRLRRGGSRVAMITSVRLVAVEHGAGVRSFPRDTSVVSGVVSLATSVLLADGTDVAGQLENSVGYDGQRSDTVYVSCAGEGPGSIMLATSGGQLVLPPSRSGIAVESLGEGGWRRVGHVYPRAARAEAIIDVPSLSHIRLVFEAAQRLEGVGKFDAADSSVCTVLLPASATHSRLGSVGDSLQSAVGVGLTNGDVMYVDFPQLASPLYASREWFLDVSGTQFEMGSAGVGAHAQSIGQAAEAPIRFALEPGRPNPFSGVTTIRYGLPVRSRVKLLVFDIAGRRVRTLQDGQEQTAGWHEVVWNRRADDGSLLPSGVYLTRYEAVGKHSERKLIVLP